MAIFGNNSFFFTAVNVSDISAGDKYSQICQEASIPFLNLVHLFQNPAGCPGVDFYFENDSIGAEQLALLIFRFIQIFNDSQQANQPPGSALFFANQAVLTLTADATSNLGSARYIYRSDGHHTQKPFISLPAIIVVSVLMLLQITGLLSLRVYNYRNPAWTDSLDAFAMARIGASLQAGSLPAIHLLERRTSKSCIEYLVLSAWSLTWRLGLPLNLPLVWHWGHLVMFAAEGAIKAK